MEKPLLAMTMGDPAGVGPETIVGAWADPRLHSFCRPLVLGHPQVLRRAVKLLALATRVVEVGSPEEAVADVLTMPCLACNSDSATRVQPATVDPRGGQAAYDAVVMAAQLAQAGRVDGITTAPLNKAALAAAGYGFPGHTELLAELCGVTEVAMMLYLAPGRGILGPTGLGVVHVTLHTAFRDVCKRLDVRSVTRAARMANAVARALLSDYCRDAPRAPRIGICALNPHAGEQGLFGDEEIRIIAPAARVVQAEGLDLEGPLPADTLMVRALAGDFDALVAMYHDQGHIALKLLGMHRAVNITLGLPIVRTSVAHGTAFDLAWRGQATTVGVVEAARVAAQLIRTRKYLIPDVSTAGGALPCPALPRGNSISGALRRPLDQVAQVLPDP